MASIIDTRDITIGIGDLQFGNYDTNGAFQGFQNVGVIKGTLNLEITRETRIFEAGRPLRQVKAEVIRESLRVAFTMAELRMANLKMAVGGGTLSTSVTPANFIDGTNGAPLGDLTDSVTTVGTSDVFSMGGQCDLTRIGLRFVHPKSCTTGKRQIVEVYFAQAEGSLTLPFSEEDWNQFEARFTAIADTSKPAGEQLFRIIDERD